MNGMTLMPSGTGSPFGVLSCKLASDVGFLEISFVASVTSANDGEFGELLPAIRDTILKGENAIFPIIGAWMLMTGRKNDRQPSATTAIAIALRILPNFIV